MMKEIAKVGKYTIRRDDKTGIALVSDGSGLRTGVHASIDRTGSVRGMKNCGYWAREDRTVRAAGFIFNIDTFLCNGAGREAERLAAKYCQCEACMERHEEKAAYETRNCDI